VPSLDRYLDAQNRAQGGFRSALDEIRTGGKRSHWIWYVFPQLRGLGSSGPSIEYAIADVAEARAYLQHPELRSRLLAITSAVAAQLGSGKPLAVVMGSSIDALKLVSSLTLFADVARQLHAAEGLDAHRDLATTAEKVLAIAGEQGYPPCRFTLDRLRANGSDPSSRRE
jgi:uncharacterized protein (DUF1810 family)